MTQPAIDVTDIRRELDQRHRDAMLDLVLAWASLDVALGMLLSGVRGLPLHEGAEQIGVMGATAKLNEVYKAVRAVPGAAEAARKLKKHKKNYEIHAAPRNSVAHACCVGVSSTDADYVVFTAFKKFGADQLVCDAIPVQQMHRATVWGRAMRDLVMRMVNVYYPLVGDAECQPKQSEKLPTS